MPFQQVPRTVQLEFQYLVTTVPIVNTLYAQFPIDYTQADVDDLAAVVGAAGSSFVIENMANVNFYTGLNVRGLNDEFDFTASYTPPAPVAGSVTSGTLPVNVAFAVGYNAGLTGRSTRGRNYVGGIPESMVGEKLVSSSWANLVVTNYTLMGGTIIGEGWLPVVVSRYHNGAKRLVAETFPVVSWGYTDLRIDTRRSRLNNS